MPQRKIRRLLKAGMLPQLSVFEAVARHGSFTRAGDELFMAQPTVSVHMKKLTETLGVPLLEQVGRQIHLTPAGRIVFDSCHEIFATLTRMDQSLGSLHTSDNGYLHLAASSSAEPMLPYLLAGFNKAYPGLRVSLQFHNRQALLARLAENEDDLYIFDRPPEQEGVVTQFMGPNFYHAYAAEDHPLAEAGLIDIERLSQWPMVAREQGSATRQIMDEVFSSCGNPPEIVMEMGSNDSIREAVRSGMGVAILPEHVRLPMTGLAKLKVVGLPLEAGWHFVYPAGKSLPASAERFMHYVREQRLAAMQAENK